jgi:hypothetical protein
LFVIGVNVPVKNVLTAWTGRIIERHETVRITALPSVSTIHEILKRNDCFDSQRRLRYSSPPTGWYLPEAAEGDAELDSFDYVEDLRLKGQHGFVQVFNRISLHGKLVCSYPMKRMTAENTASAMINHWRQFGTPAYAQFDNATVFTGLRHADCVGRVIRLCLSLDVIPVFVPPREIGFQANIERYNGLWQKGVWERFHFKNYQDVVKKSESYVEQYRDKKRTAIELTFERYEIPKSWKFQNDDNFPLRGKIIFIRRTNNKGCVNILGHDWEIDPLWTNRLLRAEVNLEKKYQILQITKT